MIRERFEGNKNGRGQGESGLGEYMVGGTTLCDLKSVVCIEMHWVNLFPLLSFCHCVSYLEVGTASPERASALSPSAWHMYQQNPECKLPSAKLSQQLTLCFLQQQGKGTERM